MKRTSSPKVRGRHQIISVVVFFAGREYFRGFHPAPVAAKALRRRNRVEMTRASAPTVGIGEFRERIAIISSASGRRGTSHLRLNGVLSEKGRPGAKTLAGIPVAWKKRRRRSSLLFLEHGRPRSTGLMIFRIIMSLLLQRAEFLFQLPFLLFGLAQRRLDVLQLVLILFHVVATFPEL